MNDSYSSFQREVYDFYGASGRHSLPWRLPDPDGSFNPYKIAVSELMLQQTQVSRVIPKYIAFLEQFHNLTDLAEASLGDVLRAWQGLGYNRRARYLWLASQYLVRNNNAQFPRNSTGLIQLPGIGRNTAGAIMVYAYNIPAVFIETNIRTVYIHHFFSEELSVKDAQIAEVVERTLDRANPREWYWALMDYGANLKQVVGNRSKQSSEYNRQPPFAGSVRQLRGRVLRNLADGPKPAKTLVGELNDLRSVAVLKALCDEGMILYSGGRYALP